jgi:hypothetical protein
MHTKESFLLVDGLNLCFKAQFNHSQMVKDIKKAMKVFRKFMGYKVQNLIIVYGLLPPNNDLEKHYNELLNTINLKKQEYELVPFYNIWKKRELEEELKILKEKAENLKPQVFCKNTDFWKNFMSYLKNELAREGYTLNKIINIPINLYRKHSNTSKIEKEDDIALAVFVGLLAPTSSKFMIFTDDRRLVEVTFKALKYSNFLSKDIGAIVRTEKVGVSLEREFKNDATIVVLNRVNPPRVENPGNKPW